MEDSAKRTFYIQEAVNRQHRELWGEYMHKQGYLEALQDYVMHLPEDVDRARQARDLARDQLERLEDTGMRMTERGDLDFA